LPNPAPNLANPITSIPPKATRFQHFQHFSRTTIECNDAESVKPLTANQKLALRAFWEAAAQSGQFDDDGEFLGLALEPWREVFYRMHTGDNSEAKRKAFQRARKDLVDAGRLAVADDIYRPTGVADKLAISRERKKFASGTAGQAGQTGTMSRHVPVQKREIAGQAGHAPRGVSRVPS
jgi:hypothetical protein